MPGYTRFEVYAALAVGPLAYAFMFRNVLIDDAFIVLVYARNLAEHFSWGFVAGEPMNTATSPLNVIGVALTTAIVRDPVRAALVFNAAVWIATILLLDRIGRRLFSSMYFVFLCVPALLFNPMLISTLGLESYLFILLFIAALDGYLRRRWTALAVAVALLTLTRFDGVLAAAVFWLFTPGWRRKARFALIYALLLPPWHLFAWIHLGSFFPDTLFIKVAQPGFGSFEFGDGLLLYFEKFPFAVTASLFLLPAAVAALFVRRHRVRRAVRVVALYGVLHYAGYCLLRVPPYEWYYASPIMCIILLAGLALAEAFRNARAAIKRSRNAVAGIAALLMLPVILVGFRFFAIGNAEMPVQTNWATCAQYASIADQLARLTSPGEPIMCYAEIGTLAYFGRLNLRNEFSDRCILKDTLDKALKSPAARLLARFNFYWRETPPMQPMACGIVFNMPPASPAASWATGTSWLESSTLYFQKLAP